VSNWTEWAVNDLGSLTPRQRRRLRRKTTAAARLRRKHYATSHRVKTKKEPPR
jgi:hypothetical protein